VRRLDRVTCRGPRHRPIAGDRQALDCPFLAGCIGPRAHARLDVDGEPSRPWIPVALFFGPAPSKRDNRDTWSRPSRQHSLRFWRAHLLLFPDAVLPIRKNRASRKWKPAWCATCAGAAPPPLDRLRTKSILPRELPRPRLPSAQGLVLLDTRKPRAGDCRQLCGHVFVFSDRRTWTRLRATRGSSSTHRSPQGQEPDRGMGGGAIIGARNMTLPSRVTPLAHAPGHGQVRRDEVDRVPVSPGDMMPFGKECRDLPRGTGTNESDEHYGSVTIGRHPSAPHQDRFPKVGDPAREAHSMFRPTSSLTITCAMSSGSYQRRELRRLFPRDDSDGTRGTSDS